MDRVPDPLAAGTVQATLVTSEPPTILAVSGESSGEQHLAGVMRAYSRRFPERPLRWVGSGGTQMRAAGAELLADVSRLAAIGPRAAMANLGSYWRLYRDLLAEARRSRPALALLVDFPEFNLRLARRLQRLGVGVCYFIGPQVWAWRPSRVDSIRRWVDRMLVILPFEVDFYRLHGVDAHYVGHPLARLLSAPASPLRAPQSESVKTVVLMPGSRSAEVESILPVQLDAAFELRRRLDCRFWLPRAPALDNRHLDALVDRWSQKRSLELALEIRAEPAVELLPKAHCAIIKSGTSTLEAMLLGVPFAMVYRMSPLSYRLLRPWVRTRTYCLANLVAGKGVVPEFIQEEARGKAVAEYLADLLENPRKMDEVKQNLRIASDTLGGQDAYEETAGHVARLLNG